MTVLNRLSASVAAVGRITVGTVLGVGLVAGLVGCATPPTIAQATASAAALDPAPAEGPALWVVRDEDSTLYLFGTVHVLRPTTEWRSPTVEAAFDSASEIWLEISNPDDQAAVIPLVQQYGVSPQTPLSSLLTPAEFAQLDVAARTMGFTAQQLDPMRPWFAALNLAVAPLVKAGYDPNSGVEMVLKSRATEAGKPVRGFETIDQQISILATLPEAVQLQFLRSTLEDFDNAVVLLDQMVEAWATGDTATLDRIVVQDMKADSQEVYDALLVRRNANWADQIETLLEGSGTVFIAVGAAHLIGEDSVQAMLERRGVTVERL